MTKRLLVIDGDDMGYFFLSVAAGTMTLSANPEDDEIILRDLRCARIHLEVEVDETPVVVSTHEPATGTALAGQELHPGEARHIGHAHLSLVALADSSPGILDAVGDLDFPQLAELAPVEEVVPAVAATAPPAEASPAAAPAQARLTKRLLVIDGADQGRSFRLPETGTTSIGKSQRYAEIVLHDLYVARVHCELQIEGDKVLVKHIEGQNGTLINGKGITQEELVLGDVLRVGNSHLRLEIDAAKDSAAGAPKDDSATVQAAPAAEKSPSPAAVKKGGNEAPSPGSGEHAALPPSALDQLLKLQGQALGHYQIGPVLGRGHSGLVFRAQDSKSNQVVTLKVLSADFSNSDAERQCFVRTLRVVAPLHHPHLVTLYAAGKTGPYCWIAREYVEGESLAELIQRLQAEGKLGWKRACRVAIQLGKALDFLEQNLVTHGNITPWNVMNMPDVKMTKLADVMLDRAVQGSKLQKDILDKKLLAELPYRAPEQTDADDVVDHRADQYALGILLYALLTGQPPFTGNSPDAVLTQIREAKVVKPSKFLRETPAPFEAAILKMLARRPEDRYQSAAELLAMVEPIASMHKIKV